MNTSLERSKARKFLKDAEKKETAATKRKSMWRQNMNGERPTVHWWYKQVFRQRFLKAHAAPQGLCENLIIAIKLSANQPKRW